MVVPVAINYLISTMETFHKILTVGKKTRGRYHYMEINKGNMYTFKYEHIKKTKINEDLKLSRDYQVAPEV